MRVIIMGGDGYIGWPTAMHFSALGNEVVVVDNYLRRQITSMCGSNLLFNVPDLQGRAARFKEITGGDISVEIGDIANSKFVNDLIKRLMPDAIIHCAEQPSAAFSQRGHEEAKMILDNNVDTTFNIIWGVLQHNPDCHIIKLGSIGEYGTPDFPIKNGWLNIETERGEFEMLFPRLGSTIYHMSKSISTQLLWFYVKRYGLRASNLMQGTVYGLGTPQTTLHNDLLPNFYYDSIFGNVVNRFTAQAISDLPLTVYGQGGQTRCYQNINDTIRALEYAASHPAQKGCLKIENQYSEIATILEVAERVQSVALSFGRNVEISQIPNPSVDQDEHDYVVETSDNTQKEPIQLLTTDFLHGEFDIMSQFADNISLENLSFHGGNN